MREIGNDQSSPRQNLDGTTRSYAPYWGLRQPVDCSTRQREWIFWSPAKLRDKLQADALAPCGSVRPHTEPSPNFLGRRNPLSILL